MSWFGFFFLPRAYCSSHLHHPPIPYSLMCYIVVFPQCLFCPKDSPGCFFCVVLSSSEFTFSFIPQFKELYLYSHSGREFNTPHHHGTSTEVAHVRPMRSSSVFLVWKMYESLYHCPQARHRQHHPWLCGRMFKWEAFPHAVCIRREKACKCTHTVVWKVTV